MEYKIFFFRLRLAEDMGKKEIFTNSQLTAFQVLEEFYVGDEYLKKIC